MSNGPLRPIGRRNSNTIMWGLSNKSYTVPATSPVLANDTFTTNNRNVQMLTVGINYLFNWGY